MARAGRSSAGARGGGARQKRERRQPHYPRFENLPLAAACGPSMACRQASRHESGARETACGAWTGAVARARAAAPTKPGILRCESRGVVPGNRISQTARGGLRAARGVLCSCASAQVPPPHPLLFSALLRRTVAMARNERREDAELCWGGVRRAFFEVGARMGLAAGAGQTSPSTGGHAGGHAAGLGWARVWWWGGVQPQPWDAPRALLPSPAAEPHTNTQHTCIATTTNDQRPPSPPQAMPRRRRC